MNKAIILNGGIAPSLSLSTLMLGRHFKLSRKMSEISGTSPLSFISTGSALKNYRIYGNEINGQYVGDKTLNLFDEDYPNIAANWDVKYRPIYVGDGNFTLSTTCPKMPNSSATNLFFLSGQVSSGADSGNNGLYTDISRTVASTNGYVTIAYRAIGTDPRNYKTMLCKGTSPADYEPYGYKIPITISDRTDTNTVTVYLTEQIEKSGSNIGFIDYSQQRHYHCDGTYTSVSLPEIHTFSGTNTLTVLSETPPLTVCIKGKISLAT